MRQIKINQNRSFIEYRTRSLDFFLKEAEALGPGLSPEEEEDVTRRVASGDKKALDRLVVANLLFVVSVAKQYQSLGVPAEDLIAEGIVGLIEAAEKFDPSKGFKFISFAVFWIRKAVIAATKQERRVHLPDNFYVEGKRIERAERKKRSSGDDDELTEDEMAEALGVKAKLVHKKVLCLETAPRHAVLTGAPVPYLDGGVTVGDCLVQEILMPPDQALIHQSLEKDITLLFARLPDREQLVLCYTFGIGGVRELTSLEIARILKITPTRVCQIRRKALGMVKKSLKGNPAGTLLLREYFSCAS